MARQSAMRTMLEALKAERVILDAKIAVLDMAITMTRMQSRRVNAPPPERAPQAKARPLA